MSDDVGYPLQDAEHLFRVQELLAPGSRLRSHRWRIGSLAIFLIKEVSDPRWTRPRVEMWWTRGPVIRLGWRQTAYSFVIRGPKPAAR